jgi:hypothetical protein
MKTLTLGHLGPNKFTMVFLKTVSSAIKSSWKAWKPFKRQTVTSGQSKLSLYPSSKYNRRYT